MHPLHIPATESVVKILICITILLVRYQRKPITLRGKRVVSGLFALPFAVVIGLAKMVLEKMNQG